MFGVAGRVVWRAGIPRMIGIGGEAVVQGGDAGDVGYLGGFEEEGEGGSELGGGDFGVAPGAAVDVSGLFY